MLRRHPSHSRPLRLIFALALLVVGLALPFVSTMLAPPAPGLAAPALPTARVQMAQRPASAQIAAVRPTLPPGVARPTPPPVSRVPVADIQPQATVPQPSSTPTPYPAPTLTSTPQRLGAVAANPAPTLFPTQPTQPPAAGAPALAGPAPILMYHYIRAVDPAIDQLGYNLSVAPDDFERQMAWLHEQGYTGVRMDELEGCLRGATCPPRPIGLTFDDGYEDAFTAALPALRRYGFRATFYIVNSLVGQPGYMTWEQIAALRDAGMEIGAHTVSHLNLTTLDEATATYEIAQSKADLDQRLGGSVTSFCYPAGFYSAATEAQVRAAGYTNATTTRWDGDYSDVLALPRRRVPGGTTIEEFAGIVLG